MRPYDLELTNYLQVGSTHPNSLKVIPAEKNKTSNFLIGDDSTSLICYQFKKGELSQFWKTNPTNKEITRVIISGSKHNIFFSAGQSIRGVNKKGKEFFKLDTSHTETIRSIHVANTFLWSAGDFILNCYESTANKVVDRFYYVSDDKINDMKFASVGGEMVMNPVLGCANSTIKVLQDDKLYYQETVKSGVLSVHTVSGVKCATPLLMYGQRNGELGLMNLQRD